MKRNSSDHDSFDLTAKISDREKAVKVEQLRSSFEGGKVSRHNFMHSALALGVSLTAASAVLQKVEAATPKGWPASNRDYRWRNQ